MDAEPDSDARPPSSRAPISGPLSDAEPAISTPMSVADPPRLERVRAGSTRRSHARLAAACALALVLIVGAGVLIHRALAGTPRQAFGVAALSADEAVLFTRRGEGPARVSALELVRSNGTLSWSHDVGPLEPFELAGFSAVAASDDRVLVLGAREGATVVEALARKSGEFAWATVVARDVAEPRAAPSLFVDGPRVYAVHAKTGNTAAITALEVDSGRALWTLDLPALDVPVAMLSAERLLVGHDGVELVDGVTGSVKRAVPMKQIACETPLGVVGFDGARHVTLLAPPGPTGEAGAAVTELDRNVSRGPCGARGSDLVLSVVKDGRRGLMRIEPTTGTQRWFVDLGAVELGASEHVDGRLPRFLPIATSPRSGGASHVVVVDVDAGVIASDHPTEARVVAVIASAERAWIVAAESLVALDDATGNVERVTSFPTLFGRGSYVRHDDVRFGVLFAVGEGLRRPSDLPWIAVDLESGRTRRANGGVTPRDTTAIGWP